MPPADAVSGPPQKFWRDYFSKHRPSGQAVAERVAALHAAKKFDEVVACLEGALLAGQSQPWMYDVLAVSMELAGRPRKDIERVLLSRVDSAATDVPQTLFSAAYLTRFGAKEQAMRMYRQAASLEPTRPEAYVLGLKLARQMKDADGVEWAATGILRSAWTKDYVKLHQEAEDAALETERSLQASGQESRAAGLREAMRAARIRDLSATLQWSGAGDLDLSVQEPLGTVCSLEEPQSPGGGVHLNDGFGPDPKNCREQYICAYGYPGVYVFRVRHVDGNIVGKRAQLTIIRNQGGSDESTETHSLQLTHEGASIRIALPAGRRKENLPAPRKVETQGRFDALLRWLDGGDRRRTVEASQIPRAGATQAGGFPAARGGGNGLAVGYQPIIQQIPEGATLTAAAIVSEDLRYVRLAVNPTFSAITDVFNFTFFTLPGGGPNSGR